MEGFNLIVSDKVHHGGEKKARGTGHIITTGRTGQWLFVLRSFAPFYTATTLWLRE